MHPSIEPLQIIAKFGADLTNLRVLVVEDSALVLILIENALRDLQWEMVGPAARLELALPIAREAHLDAALLDINLDGEMSWEVAEVLKERGIPFLFSTGYDGATVLPANLADEHVVNKPFTRDDLVEGFKRILGLQAENVGSQL